MTVPLMEKTLSTSNALPSTAGPDTAANARPILLIAHPLVPCRLKSESDTDESLIDMMKVLMMEYQRRRGEDRHWKVEECRDENRRHGQLMEMMMIMMTKNTAPVNSNFYLALMMMVKTEIPFLVKRCAFADRKNKNRIWVCFSQASLLCIFSDEMTISTKLLLSFPSPYTNAVCCLEKWALEHPHTHFALWQSKVASKSVIFLRES